MIASLPGDEDHESLPIRELARGMAHALDARSCSCLPCSQAAPTRYRPAPSRAAVRHRVANPSGSSIGPTRPASTSCISTACRASSISRRAWRPASGCSTTTTTATSMSTSCRDRCSGRARRPVSAAVSAAGIRCRSEGRLLRNDLTIHADGTRTLHFTDVTEQSGIDARGYGMGVAAGDFDNDGCVDLYLTNFGPNQLFRNNCDGTFTDVSRQSGTDDPAVFRLRLVRRLRPRWMAGSVRRQLSGLQPSRRTRRASASPASGTTALRAATGRSGTGCITTIATARSPTSPPRLWRVASSDRRSASSTADFNGDGWLDIYVANDNQENLLWMNQRDGTFRNTALLSGAALTAEGKAEASMGVDAGDFDNDGDEDLFMTELTGEGANLYVNDGAGVFEDQSARSGLGPRSLAYTGFGTAWFDFDNDGWLDILTVNGTIAAIEALRERERSVSAAPAEAVVPQSRQRAVRGRHRPGRRGVPVVRSRPRRGLRRHRQRRRRGRAGGQRRRADATADQQHRQPQTLAGTEARRRATRRAT